MYEGDELIMDAVLLPVVGLLITLTLIVLFYSKKHVQNKEVSIEFYSTRWDIKCL